MEGGNALIKDMLLLDQRGASELSVLRPNPWAVGSSGREAFV